MATINDYQAAMQAPDLVIADEEAASGQIATNWLGQPTAYPGNYAITYRIDTRNRSLALRCFHRIPHDLAERYEKISACLRALRLDRVPWCKFHREGIFAGAEWNPTILMPWLPGQPINEAIKHDRSPQRIRAIQRSFRDLMADLAAAGISHGDLQHGNLIVDDRSVVRLVDYDSMHVPGMPLHSASMGHPNYQHPRRSPIKGPRADRFPAMLIDIALRALEQMPWLWDEFDTGENLLFVKDDLVNPAASPLIQRLKAHEPLMHKVTELEHILVSDQAEILSLHALPRSAEQLRHINTFSALDRIRLLERIGDQVTVIGRPYKVHRGRNQQGGGFLFANFSARREGGFALKAWSDQRGRLPINRKVLADIRASPDKWLLMTGKLTVGHGPGRLRAPEMRVKDESQVRSIDAERAALTMVTAQDVRARAAMAHRLKEAASQAPTWEAAHEAERRLRQHFAEIGLTSLGTRQRPASESHETTEGHAPTYIDVLNRLYGGAT